MRDATGTFVLRLRAPASGEVRGVVEDVAAGTKTVITNIAELEAFLTQRKLPSDTTSQPPHKAGGTA